MVAKKQVENKTKVQVEEENDSESESEIEYDYNDNDDDESSGEDNDGSDPETEDSEDEEPETTQTPGRKKGKNSRLKRFAGSGDDDANDASNEDDDNDASNEDDDKEEIDDDTTEQPRKKKRKVSNLEKPTESEDDREHEEADNDDSDDKSEGDEEEEEEAKAHKGFANVLSKILSKKTVSSKKVILAQGKTDREIKKLKESKLPPEEQESKEPHLTGQELEERILQRKLWLAMGKVKPNPLEKNQEKQLKMIATRGVVQLFNAVKKQQKLVNENLSSTSTERKKDMIIESMNKKSFINLLQNTKVDVSMGSAEKETPTAKEPERKIWSVLQDDFVIGTGKMKDWNKHEDDL